jgi:hypothetical protein
MTVWCRSLLPGQSGSAPALLQVRKNVLDQLQLGVSTEASIVGICKRHGEFAQMFAIRMMVGCSMLIAGQWAPVPDVAADEQRCFAFTSDADPSSLHLGLEVGRAGCAGLLLLAENGPRERPISREQRLGLDAEIAQLPVDLRARFDERYRAWRITWERPDILFSSNSKAVRNSDEFCALASLGPQILPLVVDKLLQPAEFFALQLYDVLQDQPELREDDHRGQGEQQRALATARRWLSR